MNFTLPISDQRRIQEVNLRKDASRQYGRTEGTRAGLASEVRPPSAVVDFGSASAELRTPVQSAASERPAADPRLPFAKPPPSRELLERAMSAFGLQQEGTKQGFQAPPLPIVERPDHAVPFDVLQRAAAAQDTEDEEESQVLRAESPRVDVESTETDEVAEALQNVFAAAKAPGEPFGRAIPFDITELAIDEAAESSERVLVSDERDVAAPESDEPRSPRVDDAPPASPARGPVAPSYEHSPSPGQSVASAERQAFAEVALSRARSQVATEHYQAAPGAESPRSTLQTELGSGAPLVPGFELAV